MKEGYIYRYLFFFQKRATVRTQDYFYHPISNTPFSLGIALPRDHGKYRVKGEIEVSLAKFNSKCENISNEESKKLMLMNL